MPYDIIEVGQQGFRKWLVTWWHQAITWRSELLWYSSEGNFTEMIEISVFDISLEITHLRLQPYLPGATEFKLAAPYHKKLLKDAYKIALTKIKRNEPTKMSHVWRLPLTGQLWVSVMHTFF